jgi:hypothetical protein
MRALISFGKSYIVRPVATFLVGIFVKYGMYSGKRGTLLQQHVVPIFLA